MSTTTDRILDSLMSRVQGLDTAFAQAELLSACESFFERSFAWRETLRVTIRAGKRDTTIIPTVQSSRILHVYYLGDASQTVQLVPFTVEGEQSTALMQFIMPSTLRLRVAREEDFVASLAVALTSNTLGDFPEDLLARWREGITNEALARLYAVPSRPWTSNQLALWHGRLAKRDISEAHRMASRGYGGPLWQFPPFA